MVGLVLRPAAADRTPPSDPMGQLRQETTGETRFFIDLLNVFGARDSETKLVNEAAFEAYILPRLAPILTLVQQTGGSVITQDRQIDLALEQMRSVWRLWYRVQDLALSGIHELRVLTRDDSPIDARVPRWISLDEAAASSP